MEYSPPPLFKQGASARAKVFFFTFIAIALLVADSRLHAINAIRKVVGTVLYPLQVAVLVPRDLVYGVGDYFIALSTVQKENKNLKQQQVVNAQTLQQAQQLMAENAQLRKLLGTSEQVALKSLMSEILYDARDAFTRKIVLNRGSQQGVAMGQPVIDDIGVVGQVTRVFPFTSEVTLLTDKDQAIPVQVVRNGLRSVAYGRGQSGVLDLRFMAANADVQKGDMLVTSGIDGVYPPGLAVAKVVHVESKSSDAFARIVCQPAAGIDRNRQLLILLADTKVLPRPDDVALDKKDKSAKKRFHDAAKELDKEAARVDPAKPQPKETLPVSATTKEATKELPKEVLKEVPKEVPKLAPKDTPKVVAIDAAKDAAKVVSKVPPKEVSKDTSKVAPKEIQNEKQKVISGTKPPAVTPSPNAVQTPSTEKPVL